MKFFLKNRTKWFPEITDWTQPFDNIRYLPNHKVKDISYKKWFWFHPTAFNIINYGINSIAIIVFSLFLVYSIIEKKGLLMLLLIIMLLCNIIALKKKISNKKATEYMTFYDVWLRD